MVDFNEKTKGIFLYKRKKKCEKSFILLFQHNWTYSCQKHIGYENENWAHIFYWIIFGPDITVSIFENLNFWTFKDLAHCLYFVLQTSQNRPERLYIRELDLSALAEQNNFFQVWVINKNEAKLEMAAMPRLM